MPEPIITRRDLAAMRAAGYRRMAVWETRDGRRERTRSWARGHAFTSNGASTAHRIFLHSYSGLDLSPVSMEVQYGQTRIGAAFATVRLALLAAPLVTETCLTLNLVLIQHEVRHAT